MKATKICDEFDVSYKTKRIALQILEDNSHESEIYLFGVVKTGYYFAELIKKEIALYDKQLKVYLGKIEIDKKNPLAHKINYSTAENKLNDKVVVLVDDVANTGKTLFYALEPLTKINTAKLQIAVLVDRKHKKFPICADFVGVSLNTTIQEHIEVVLDKESAVYLH